MVGLKSSQHCGPFLLYVQLTFSFYSCDKFHWLVSPNFIKIYWSKKFHYQTIPTGREVKSILVYLGLFFFFFLTWPWILRVGAFKTFAKPQSMALRYYGGWWLTGSNLSFTVEPVNAKGPKNSKTDLLFNLYALRHILASIIRCCALSILMFLVSWIIPMVSCWGPKCWFGSCKIVPKKALIQAKSKLLSGKAEWLWVPAFWR